MPTDQAAARSPRHSRRIVAFVASAAAIALLCGARDLSAQQPLTRAAAIATALGASVRVSAIGADTLAAAARLRSAREYPNPSFNASYSRSVPQNHFSVEIPLDLPPARGARVHAAEAGRASAKFNFVAARAAIELDVDTMYTTAQGSALRAELSHATAMDAERLLVDTKKRRDAGDASDLDVNLAEVSAGQAANVANADSLEAIDTMLELQMAMGIRGDTIVVKVIDSLRAPSPGVDGTQAAASAHAAVPAAVSTAEESPTVAAAGAALTAAQQTLSFQRRSVFAVPALQLGVEARDPTGSEKGLLPTFGIVLPIPIFNRNGGEISAAGAEVTRARANLALARLEASSQLARARRTEAVAEARIGRDETIMNAATRNVALVERAYSEGEMAIGDILEARRAEHDAQAQYVTDLMAANIGAALVRMLTTDGVTR